jgi:hypothetical protein
MSALEAIARLDAIVTRYGKACREDARISFDRTTLEDARAAWAWTDAIREDYQREADNLLARIEESL